MFPSLMTIPGELLSGFRATGRRYVAGIDGGATKTVAAVLSLETFEMRFGHGGPSNVDAVGVTAAASAISAALTEALGAAGVDAAAVGSGVVGLAGTPSDELVGLVRAEFPLDYGHHSPRKGPFQWYWLPRQASSPRGQP